MDEPVSSVRVVGIGASAGGIDSLKEFFSEMPADSGLAFVVVQHLDPTHASYMAGLLARQTTMKVAEAQDESPIQANRIYTIPPNKFLSVRDGMLRLTEAVKRDGLRLPIDFFFRSLAQDQHEKAIAVLFSGSGSDGTLGIREIRGAGGLVIVQNPETAQFDSMIESAIATGLVDYVLPIRQIPGKLLQYVKQPRLDDGADVDQLDDVVSSILNLLVDQNKSDFRCYKRSTVQRRIERRMALYQIPEISDYHRLLCENPDERTRLSKDMLIGVTSFFRDAEAFENLREKVIVPLVQEKNNASPLRVWIAGCATGEEAYSVVMLLMEEMARARKNFSLQIFASDIDRDALKSAREAIYSQSITADVSEERLARFFVKKDGTYQIDKRVREAVTFAEHNVITDPPFLRMDLISCRNLMIYIEPEVQRKVINLFAFALLPGKYLFLGKSDTTIEQSDPFEPVSRSWRIFQRRQLVLFPAGGLPIRTGLRPARFEEQHPIKLSDLNQQVLLKHFNASIVLINETGEIAHFYGPTHKYLAHPYGDANLNLFEMIDAKHSLALRLAVERAVRENDSVNLRLSELNREDGSEFVDVTITPVVEPRSNKRLLAVIFEAAAAAPKSSPVSVQETHTQDVDVVAQLEADNQRLKQDLQTAIESFQSTHEEFAAANEEVLAVNEELQSANEELETSKEELQSVNEELITVNNQLNDKVEELNKTNDDLANFLNSSEVGTLFLDKGFCVRRFTPSATTLLNLIPSDVGRPVSHISNQFIDVDPIAIAATVLRNLTSFEKEVETSDGHWYMLRCMPYRTLGDVIDGVVFTFTEVTRLKRSEEAMMEARNYAESIIHTIRESLLVLDPQLKVVSANRAFYETFQVAPEETENRLVYELGNHQWDIPRLRQFLEEVLRGDSHFESFEVEHEFPTIGHKIMSLNARTIDDQQRANAWLILLAIDDVTEQRRAEEEGRRLEDQLRQAQKMESIGTLAAGVAHDFNNILNIIQGYASLLKEPGTQDEEVAETGSVIVESTKRGAEVVRQLLTLARKTEPRLEATDVNTLLHELMHLLKQTLPKSIEVTSASNHELPPVVVDLNQITQALLNICVNARDAMPEGGRLTLKTEVVARKSLQEDGEANAERYVCIAITDTGTGIDEKVQHRIFEPFFTTKGRGQGTGLGLSVTYGIVKNHNGLIQVESKPMHGTTFRVYLPVVSSRE
jgi:two-component system, chemotaxis family, CheB/CheR fusion protein